MEYPLHRIVESYLLFTVAWDMLGTIWFRAPSPRLLQCICVQGAPGVGLLVPASSTGPMGKREQAACEK